jgi:hypothetical protein
MLDDQILFEAREIASSQDMSLGEVFSQLARRGLDSTPSIGTKGGLPVFRRATRKGKVALVTVLRAEAEE